MRKFINLILVVLVVFSLATVPAYASNIPVKVDGIIAEFRVEPFITNNCTMVPLRAMSENLGAEVSWSADAASSITVRKNNIKITFDLVNVWAVSGKAGKISLPDAKQFAVVNGTTIALAAKPCIIQDTTMVPLRFLAEYLGGIVNYSNQGIEVTVPSLMVNSERISTLQSEFHMTMGGVISHINGNGYITAVYNIIKSNLGAQIVAPDSYSWGLNELTQYTKGTQYDYLDGSLNTIQRYDVYYLNSLYIHYVVPTNDPTYVIHDVTNNQWYIFDQKSYEKIGLIIYRAKVNGFHTIISDTVV